jgi:hypothetical protein
MYFSKSINHNIQSSTENHHDIGMVDLSDYYRYFYFLDSVYHDKSVILKKIYSEYDDRLIPDIAAFSSGLIVKDQLKIALECVRDIIIDKGYDELTELDLQNKLNLPTTDVNNILLIAGCQNRQMLDARIKKAVELAELFHKNLLIVVSGGNPANEKPSKIRKEATRMVNLFEEGIKEAIPDRTKRPRIEVLPEDKSENTKDNISKFFESGFLSDKIPNQILVVSSTSHLIRLSFEIENYLQNNQESFKSKISNVLLAGSEELGKTFFITNDNLIKHIFLEVIDYLIKKKQPYK